MPSTLTALTNGASIAAQTNIKNATGLAQNAANRISKGLKIDGLAAEKGIYTKLNAKVLGNEQVASNLAQGASVTQVAAGGMDQLNQIVTRISTLAIQANSDTVSEAERAGCDIEAQQQLAQFDNVLNTVDWLGVKLLQGSAGTVTVETALAAPAAAGLNVVANAFAGTLTTASTSGHVEGAISAAPVVTQVGDAYNVTLMVGEQTFQGIGVRPVAAGIMSLISGSNTLSFDFDATAVTAITNAASFTTALKTLVGWNDNTATAKFQAVSTAPANGLPATGTGYIAGSTVTAGKYALSYDGATSNTFTLTSPDGSNSTQTVTAAGAQTVTFNNGFNFNLDSTFVLATAQAQIMFDIASGGTTTLSFQSDTYGGTTNVTMPSLDRVTLNLNNISLKTKAGALAAQPLLESAMNVINQSSAQVIAVQKRLELAEASATTARENLIAARAVVGDTDLAKETTEFTKYNVLSQAGIAMKAQADQMFNNLLALVRG